MSARKPSADAVEGLSAERVEWARWALFQIEALIPAAQPLVDGEDSPDLLLALLGRMHDMTMAALVLVGPDQIEPSDFAKLRLRIKGPAK